MKKLGEIIFCFSVFVKFVFTKSKNQNHSCCVIFQDWEFWITSAQRISTLMLKMMLLDEIDLSTEMLKMTEKIEKVWNVQRTKFSDKFSWSVFKVCGFPEIPWIVDVFIPFIGF